MASRAEGRTGISNREQAGERAVDRDQDDAGPFARDDDRPRRRATEDRHRPGSFARRCRSPPIGRSTVALTPMPVCDANSTTVPSANPRSLAATTIAWASGCSDWPSTAAASASISFSPTVPIASIAISDGLAFRQRARLVDDQRIDLIECL